MNAVQAPLEIREAVVEDAPAMSEVLKELVASGQRTRRADAGFVLSHYIQHPHRLHCFVAVDDQGDVLGFQSLKLAHQDNDYGTPVGWGIIGTHIRPSAARRGIGSELFLATRAAARAAKLQAIEAYIGDKNIAALGYYEAMSFMPYRRSGGALCKIYRLTADVEEVGNRRR